MARNPHLYGELYMKPNAKRLRQSSKPLVNELEREWLSLICNGDRCHSIKAQAIRFRLGNGIWYKPDFTGYQDGQLTAWEVKGPHAFRGGFENLKVAAATFLEWQWILVWKDDKGCWQHQMVLP